MSVYQMLVIALVLSRLDYGNAVLVGVPSNLYSRLQSLPNAAARSIAGLRHSDHITDARQFSLVESAQACAVQAGDDRLSLAERQDSITPGCRPATFVRHAVKTTSVVLTDTPTGCPPVAVRTVGDRAFAVASAQLWNSLPPDIVACNTLSQFRRELRTFLFTQSYPSLLLL